MKNYIRVIVFFILLAAIFPGANLFAQNSDKQDSLIDSLLKKAREVEKSTEKMKSDTAKGQGAAYGKNKGELSGREFAQWRLEEARNKIETKVEELEGEVVRIEEVLRETQIKLEEFKFELAQKEKAGGFSSDEKLKRRERIQTAEEKVKELEAAIEEEKTALRHMKDEIADQAAEAAERR